MKQTGEKILERLEEMKQELIDFILKDHKAASRILKYDLTNCYQFANGTRNLSYSKILELYGRFEKYSKGVQTNEKTRVY